MVVVAPCPFAPCRQTVPGFCPSDPINNTGFPEIRVFFRYTPRSSFPIFFTLAPSFSWRQFFLNYFFRPSTFRDVARPEEISIS